MNKISINKELINNIANLENKKYIKQTNKLINNIIGATIEKMEQQVSFVSLKNTILQPVNELLTGAIIDNSAFIYILGINNPQLELNTIKGESLWKNFKEKFIIAWRNRKSIFNRRKRKKKKFKKNKDENLQFTNKPIDVTKYNLSNLVEDFQSKIILFLSETSLTYLFEDRLELVGKDDFGANTKIVIYPMIYDGNIYKYYVNKKKGFVEINLENRIANIEKKISEVGENYIKMLKIFNYLYFNVNLSMCNQIFLESILCSIPNNFYIGEDIFKVFLKIINYLSINKLKDVKSINNNSLSIYKDEVCQNSGLGFYKMINSVITNKS